MSQPSASPGSGEAETPPQHEDPIQFDQAEYSGQIPCDSGAICANCRQPIADAYFEIGGKVICASCRQRIEAAFRGGNRMARGIKALLFGMVAAFAGAIGYYVFVRATNANWSLIAVVVGLMVGGAVRRGSANRGGRFYQLLAVFLTYCAIVGMNMSLYIDYQLQHPKQDRALNGNAAGGRQPLRPRAKGQPEIPETATKDATEPVTKNPRPRAEDLARPITATDLPAAEKGVAATNQPAGPRRSPSVTRSFTWLVFVFVLFFPYPVIEAFHAPISAVIYAFALWEAWKINKKVHLTFNGPFRVSAAAEPAFPPEAVGDGA